MPVDFHLSGHMAAHILAMNLIAPALVIAAARQRRAPRAASRSALATASLLHIMLLYGWHSPAAFRLAADGAAATVLMHASLFAAALWFWTIVHRAASGRHPCAAMAALLLTGKVVCLLGVLLTFSPHPLYGHALADQQRAGLLMLVACPLTYFTASIATLLRWMDSLHYRRFWRLPAGAG